MDTGMKSTKHFWITGEIKNEKHETNFRELA